jgi:outer membrane protein assembly factor BamB
MNFFGQATMKLKINSPVILILVCLVFHQKSDAQLPSIQWWYNTHDASYGQSSAADLDGDGSLEIIFGCYRNDSSVYALNAENGTLLWKYNTHPAGSEGCNDAAPAIYDVDNDDSLEVIVASSCNPVTYCFNGRTGAVKWMCPTHGSDSPPAIGDIDNDGMPEILHGEFGGYVICINGENGSIAWELPVDLNSWIQTAPTIVDLDGDGQLDFVVGTWNFSGLDSIYAFRGNDHSRMWSYPVHDYMYHGTAVADLDNDGMPELVIGSYNDTLYCINGENGTTKWKYAASGGYIGGPACIGDIDNDGRCDVIFVSSYVVTCLSDSGTHKWHYNIPGFEQSFRGAALADINNDSIPDVIFGTDGGKLMALNGNNGTLIWSKDLAADYGNSNFAFDNAPLIADFNHDDSLDVFIVGGYGSYPNFQSDFGRAYMLTAGKGHGPDWLMFQHDILRQSSLCSQTITSVNEISRPFNISCFPNPCDNNLTVIGTKKDGVIFLYSVMGEEITTLKSSADKTEINTKKLSPGMYFLNCRSTDKSVNIKFLKQ